MAAAIPNLASSFFLSTRGFSEQNLLVEPRRFDESIASVEDDGYVLLKPIVVSYERTNNGYIASFREANIAIVGTSKFDARQALEVEILDAFDDWTANESALGPGPKQQLSVLKTYLKKS